VDGPSAAHVWAESYDRELKDIFAVQDKVRQEIRAGTESEADCRGKERFRRFPTDNLEAMTTCLHGLEYVGRFTQESFAQARQMFERAPRVRSGVWLFGRTKGSFGN